MPLYDISASQGYKILKYKIFSDSAKVVIIWVLFTIQYSYTAYSHPKCTVIKIQLLPHGFAEMLKNSGGCSKETYGLIHMPGESASNGYHYIHNNSMCCTNHIFTDVNQVQLNGYVQY